MKTLCLSLLLSLLAGCLIGPPASLEMGMVGDVIVAEGQTHVTALYVTGATPGSEVFFSAEGLPPFAVLEGNMLRLSPVPGDAGEYVVTLKATDGWSEDSRTIRLLVRKDVNTAPEFITPGWFDADGTFLQFSGAIRVKGTPYMTTAFQDAEEDTALLLAELRPVDQPFTGTATHQTALQHDTQVLRLYFVGITPGVTYHLQVWLADGRGLRNRGFVLSSDLRLEPR